MAAFVQSFVAEGRTVPVYPHGTEELYQHQDMLLASLHTAGCEYCRAALAALRAASRELSERQSRLVMVDSLHAAKVAESFGVEEGTAAVGVVDRFGRLYAVLDVHGAEAHELAVEALSWIDYIQSQCEECGAPTW